MSAELKTVNTDVNGFWRRVVIWLIHQIVTVLLLSTWIIAGPGIAVAWIIEKIAEQVECWEIELQTKNTSNK